MRFSLSSHDISVERNKFWAAAKLVQAIYKEKAEKFMELLSLNKPIHQKFLFFVVALSEWKADWIEKIWGFFLHGIAPKQTQNSRNESMQH